MNEEKNDIIEDLREDWKLEKIGTVTVQSSTINPLTQPDKRFTYIDIGSINNEKFNIQEPKMVLGKETPSRARKSVTKKSILFATTRPNLKNIAIVNEDYENPVASTGFCVIQANEKVIDYKFLFYYLITETVQTFIKPLIRGAQYPAISDKDVLNIEIPLPPLNIQKEIVVRLNSAFERIDKAIQLVQENLEHIKHLVPATLNDIFENLSSSTQSFRFDEFLKLSRGHNPPKSDFVYGPQQGYTRFIQIRDGASDLHAVYVPSTNKLKLVTKDDLLIVAYRQVGKVFRGIEGAFNVALCKVTNKDKSRIDTNYIYYLIQSDFVKGELLKRSERALIPSMSVDHLAELQVPIPDIASQQKTVQYLERLNTQQQQLQKQYTRKLQQLKSLKASLLEAAFRGDLIQQATKAKVIQLQPEKISLVAEDKVAYQTLAPLNIPKEKSAAARVVLAAKIISLHQADENWTRIKFQKLLYLAEHIIKADWEMKYFIQTAGPLDNHFLYDELQPALKKKKWFQEVDYRYYPLAKAEGVEKEYKQYFEPVDNRLSKLFKSFLKATEAQSEIAATLYAVWNNLLIKQDTVSEERIIEGFYKWSERKEQYKQEQLISALKWMKENDLVPEGFGKEIKKAKK